MARSRLSQPTADDTRARWFARFEELHSARRRLEDRWQCPIGYWVRRDCPCDDHLEHARLTAAYRRVQLDARVNDGVTVLDWLVARRAGLT